MKNHLMPKHKCKDLKVKSYAAIPELKIIDGSTIYVCSRCKEDLSNIPMTKLFNFNKYWQDAFKTH